MITFYNPDYCTECNTEHSLYIYDVFNNGTSMRNLINNSSILSKKGFEYMRCTKCKKEFNIDWSGNKRFPFPLVSDLKLNQFLIDFRDNNTFKINNK